LRPGEGPCNIGGGGDGGQTAGNGGKQDLRSYVLPMALCFIVGLLHFAAINWTNVPPD
jgi:hypothetical protein